MWNRSFAAVVYTWVLLVCLPANLPANYSGPPVEGAILPSLELAAPPVDSDRDHLGVNGTSFDPRRLDCRLLLIEIIGVYCPLCHQQAPHFNRVFARLKKRNLDKQVKMLAVAAGGTNMEVEFLRSNGAYEYPIVPDESFSAHQLLGEPKTPFTLVVSKDGKVLYSHQGIIEDVDGLFQLIQGHLEGE